LGFVNGYPVQPKPILGIGLDNLNVEALASEEELIKALNYDQSLLYGDKRPLKSNKAAFVPAHVAYDKVV
jgi:hypothetical protein